MSRRRRAELRVLLAAVPVGRRGVVVDGLRSLAEAAGEVSEPDWAVGGVAL